MFQENRCEDTVIKYDIAKLLSGKRNTPLTDYEKELINGIELVLAQGNYSLIVEGLESIKRTNLEDMIKVIENFLKMEVKRENVWSRRL